MADILNALGKSRKAALPPGWVEGISRKHPDKPFYFNENTGTDSSWSPPIELEDKKKSERKSKKRKNDEIDSEEFSDASPGISKQLLNNISRPILKAKVRNAAPKEPSCDTPTMRFYREKMSQRKIGAERKKGGAKSARQKKAETNATQEKFAKVSAPPTPLCRNQRSSSIVSSSSSVSDYSDVTSTSSMGTKITRAVATASGTASPKTDSGSDKQARASKLPKISKINVFNEDKSKRNLTDNNDKIINSKNSNDNEYTNILRQTFKKNTAYERMSKIRKNLSAQKKNPFTTSNDDEPSSKKSRVQGNGGLEVTNFELQRNEDEDYYQNKSILEKIDPSNLYCEEMEWEPIEDEKIMSEVYTARLKVCEKSTDTRSEISFNVLKSANIPGENNAPYIVIDTNVFLSNLSYIEEIKDSNSDVFGRPFIVIPWTVLQELDFIKDDKNNTRSPALKLKARKAVEYLNRHFTTKHPRFLGQTPTDVIENRNKFMIECPDDEILQTCLQIKESAKSPVLLSYDKNLCTKALIHDVPVIGRDDSLEKIYNLKAPETTHFLSNSLHAHTEEKQEDNSIFQQELLLADDIMEEGKAVLKSILSQVVAKEMENLFGSRWEKHVIIHPPWSVLTVLKCALKHWMAAVSESFERRTEPMLRDLQLCITNIPEGGRKLKDVKIFLNKFMDIIQTLNNEKYPTFKNKVVAQIDDLMQKCLNLMNKINGVRLQESVGSVEENKEEKSASQAFKILEDIYAFARDTCGIASDALGLQCAFTFNKFHPFLTPKLALQQQQEIAINVNKLLEILTIVLSNDHENMCTNDKIIISLYEVLVNFSSNLCHDELSKLTPVDVLCCIKLKRPKLEKGYEQLRELAIHFCRMANFQCI